MSKDMGGTGGGGAEGLAGDAKRSTPYHGKRNCVMLCLSTVKRGYNAVQVKHKHASIGTETTRQSKGWLKLIESQPWALFETPDLLIDSYQTVPTVLHPIKKPLIDKAKIELWSCLKRYRVPEVDRLSLKAAATKCRTTSGWLVKPHPLGGRQK